MDVKVVHLGPYVIGVRREDGLTTVLLMHLLAEVLFLVKLRVQCFKKGSTRRSVEKGKRDSDCNEFVCVSVSKVKLSKYILCCRYCTVFKLSYLFQCG